MRLLYKLPQQKYLKQALTTQKLVWLLSSGLCVLQNTDSEQFSLKI
jgi:hypothetical protein